MASFEGRGGEAAYLHNFGDLVHYHDHGQVRFIFAFTMPLEIGSEVAGYNPLRQVEALLEEAAGRPQAPHFRVYSYEAGRLSYWTLP